MRLSEAERNLSQLTAQFAATSVVQAPVAGRVIETKVAEGSVVTAGASIASIQSGEQGLELMLYVPPEHGKAVKPGMLVRIEPATVEEVTESGSQGLVTWLLFELPLYVAYQ